MSKFGFRVHGLDHVQLAMPAGQEMLARAFYGGVLGLTEVTKPVNLAARGGVWFAGDRLRLHLGVEHDFRPAKKAHPAFLVEHLPALRAHLELAGAAVAVDEPLEGYQRIYVADPFGNRIELLEPIAGAIPAAAAPVAAAPSAPVSDEELVEIARGVIAKHYRDGQHQMAAALRTLSGKVQTGIHVEAKQGRMSLCAEAVALGAAATVGDTEIDVIVAVTESGDIVPPCGMCRELISDYSPTARVILETGSNRTSVEILELLPQKYRAADYPNRRAIAPA